MQKFHKQEIADAMRLKNNFKNRDTVLQSKPTRFALSIFGKNFTIGGWNVKVQTKTGDFREKEF